MDEEAKVKTPGELTPEDYQKALDKLAELKPLTRIINSVRVNDAVDQLYRMLKEELKEILFKQYEKAR